MTFREINNNLLAEYILEYITTPIGVAEYMVTESLPENLKTDGPIIGQIEKKLGNRV